MGTRSCTGHYECCRRSKSSNARNELSRAMANIATVEQGARVFCSFPALEMFRSLVSNCEDNVHEVIGLACAINNITARIALVGLPCCFAGNAGFEIWELLCHCACRESMNDEAREWTARVYINLSLSPQGQCMTWALPPIQSFCFISRVLFAWSAGEVLFWTILWKWPEWAVPALPWSAFPIVSIIFRYVCRD